MQNAQQDTPYAIGPWTFHPSLNELRQENGHTVRLEDKISLLLLTLCQRRDQIVDKQTLINEVWAGRELSEQTIPVAISKLRKALGDDINRPLMLATIPRQGYQLLTSTVEQSQSVDKGRNTAIRWAAVCIIVGLLTAVSWILIKQPINEQSVRTQVLNAQKPGVIVTINDVRPSQQSDENNRLAIAVSELSAYYLAQVPDLLVIRHWWNLDAPDPTGGIFTRYGASTPVYSLKGTLLMEDGKRLVTFVLSDPKTDEVIWSGLHKVKGGSSALFPLFETMIATLPVNNQQMDFTPAPDESVAFWRARYFMELANSGAASIAAEEFAALFADQTPSRTARLAAAALQARWKNDIDMPDTMAQSRAVVPSDEQLGHHLALVDQAALTLFSDTDPASALVLLDKALLIAPGDHYAHSLRGEALLASGDTAAAIEAFQLAYRLAPYARAYRDRLSAVQENISSPSN